MGRKGTAHAQDQTGARGGRGTSHTSPSQPPRAGRKCLPRQARAGGLPAAQLLPPACVHFLRGGLAPGRKEPSKEGAAPGRSQRRGREHAGAGEDNTLSLSWAPAWAGQKRGDGRKAERGEEGTRRLKNGGQKPTGSPATKSGPQPSSMAAGPPPAAASTGALAVSRALTWVGQAHHTRQGPGASAGAVGALALLWRSWVLPGWRSENPPRRRPRQPACSGACKRAIPRDPSALPLRAAAAGPTCASDSRLRPTALRS